MRQFIILIFIQTVICSFVDDTPDDIISFINITNTINLCLGNSSNLYTISLFNSTDLVISRNDDLEIDLSSQSDSLLSDCLSNINTSFNVITYEQLYNDFNSDDSYSHSYTEASGPFGRYEWNAFTEIRPISLPQILKPYIIEIVLQYCENALVDITKVPVKSGISWNSLRL